MKFSTLCTLLVAGSAAAFAPQRQSFVRNSALQAEPTSSRGEFLAQFGAVVAATTLFPGAANAAKYGGIGYSSPNVLDPKDVEIDDEIFKSEAVQNSLTAVKRYRDIVGQMKSALASNDQINLGPAIRKEFDFVKLRSDLNTVNTAFDEDSQRGTDRLIRVIMQDITELEISNTQKDGIARSERRVANLNAKLDKLAVSFNDFLSFAA